MKSGAHRHQAWSGHCRRERGEEGEQPIHKQVLKDRAAWNSKTEMNTKT
jgi:hypothetical protein